MFSAENIVGDNETKSQMLVALKPMKWNVMQNLTFLMSCLAWSFWQTKGLYEKIVKMCLNVYLSSSFTSVSHK